MKKTTILECFDCSGSLNMVDTMFDERYVVEHCPYCGSTNIELDEIHSIQSED